MDFTRRDAVTAMKWSLVISGVGMMMILGLIAGGWLALQLLVWLAQ
jgi:hypothetical protein